MWQDSLKKMGDRVGVYQASGEPTTDYIRRIKCAYPTNYPEYMPLLELLNKFEFNSVRWLMRHPHQDDKM